MKTAAAFGFLAGFVAAVAANLTAQYLINNVRAVRRVTGPL